MVTYDSNTSQNSYNYISPALRKSLDMIKEAVQGEREDQIFYDYLVTISSSDEEKQILRTIRDDEIRHNHLFKKIYRDFTNQDIRASQDVKFQRPNSYLDGIRMALFGELKAVEKYREIRKGLPNTYYRDLLFDIITDELKHSSKYNYIYTINLINTQNRLIGDHIGELETENYPSQIQMNKMNLDIDSKLSELSDLKIEYVE